MWRSERQDSRGLSHRTPLAALIGMAALALLLAACGGSTATKQSAPPMKRVGLMHVGLDHVPPSLKPLEARLRELGWVSGRNIDLISQIHLPDEDAAYAQARGFVRKHVDLIVAFEDQSVRQAKAATVKSHTPVVFLHPVDPVQAGSSTASGTRGAISPACSASAIWSRSSWSCTWRSCLG